MSDHPVICPARMNEHRCVKGEGHEGAHSSGQPISGGRSWVIHPQVLRSADRCPSFDDIGLCNLEDGHQEPHRGNARTWGSPRA